MQLYIFVCTWAYQPFAVKAIPAVGLVALRTCDQAVVGSTPGRAAVSLPRTTPEKVNRVPAWLAGVKAGRVHLCQVVGNTV